MSEIVANQEQARLDEVMLAMDVVDTLRHRELMLEREVHADVRDQHLLERLREIYTSQGIAVSDDVLDQGVRALREDRFVHPGTTPSLARTLATLYVTRGRWGRWVGLALVALVVGVLAFQLLIWGPASRAVEELPRDLASTYASIAATAQDGGALADAERMLASGQGAVERRDLSAARAALADLRSLEQRLEQQYELRIVSRPGELSALWRVPEDNPAAQNYYLIVEAIDPAGAALELPVRNEEDGRVERVTQWGLRVDEETFDRIAADKRDDGIIQDPVVGMKRRGALDVEYTVPTTGAAITRW